MTLYMTVKDAYREYLEHLSAGGKQYRVPERKHRPHKGKGKVYASELGSCPLKNALKRNGAPMTNPPTESERLSSLHLMRQGAMDALPFQEAIMWKFGKGALKRGGFREDVITGANAEVSVESRELRVRGRMDLLLRLDGIDHVIEIKRRDARRNDDHPQPKFSDVLQVLAYHAITGITSLNIVILNRYYFKLWTLKPEDNGFVLVDEVGTRWDNPFNTPEHINLNALRFEIQRQLDYLNGISTVRPIDDPLNDERSDGWYCFKWENGQRPKFYSEKYAKQAGRPERTEFVVARCPFFCHYPLSPGNEPRIEVRETGYQTETYEFVDPLPAPF